jgi:D-cysteine desulfhydrase
MPAPPRVSLALLPTPIVKLERLSRELGVELFVKRDDLTGLLESGNKVRKLEFLVAEALAAGADTLVTCGTVQSNCCRAVAATAARLGMRAVLVVAGERPDVYDGNLLLGRLLGAELRFLPGDQLGRAGEVMAAIADEVRQAGGHPYVIPESGATEVGALGYLECAVELAGQIAHGAPRFDAIAIAAYSGGSQAGLLMGKQLGGLPSEIVGIPIAWPSERVRESVTATMRASIRRFGLAIDVPKAIHLLDGYQGAGRADVADAEIQAIVRLARQEGIVLDPVYTGKAFSALMDTLRRDRRALGQRVCFVHTGGLFGLFPLRERLTRLIDNSEGGFAPLPTALRA